MLLDAPFHTRPATAPWSPECKFLCWLISHAPEAPAPLSNLPRALVNASQNCGAAYGASTMGLTLPPPNTPSDFSERPAHKDAHPVAPKKQVQPPSSKMRVTSRNIFPSPAAPPLPAPPVAPFPLFPSPSMSAFPPRETPAKKDSAPHPTAGPFHRATPITPHPATSPTPALFGPLLCSAFSPAIGSGPPKDGSSALHLENGAGFFSAEATATPPPGCPLSPRETASTERKSAAPRIVVAPRQARADPPPPTRANKPGNPIPEYPPSPLFVWIETRPVPARNCARYGSKALAPPPNAGETWPF